MTTAEHRWSVWSCDAHLLVDEPRALPQAIALAEERLREIGDACDRFRADSELSRLPSGTPVQISGTLAWLVRCALDGAALTEGLCDPTVGSDVAALGYDRDIRLVLDDDRPVGVLVRHRAGWRSIELDGDVLTVPAGIRLDLGATAKAAAADLIAEEIAVVLGTAALVNLGGDIATAGRGPADGWQVRVQDVPGDPAARIALHAGFALATSSTQRRSWRRGDRQVQHIVDPRTGDAAAPVWRTVSVVAPTALEANARSTAAIVAGEDALLDLAGAGRAARLVDARGAVHVLGGWPAESTDDLEVTP
ncbi:FAD:protein FMN transferase [Amnibacterium kyonggiense]|uniref:FAD:protein FMN transferase n=1 Tax=Amnibacterium kyonggiense TaxID=595671 RepID=A0A4R7FPA7_9MICO|nr:FAD:protein FMN transferase [Amnibacterium kyonggiense]TDS79486.1 thiamine biosynthesis lipoprotein [Amnibacterium kyonggiense]